MQRHFLTLVALIAGCCAIANAAPTTLPPSSAVVFASQTPRLRLTGLLYRPASAPAPAIVIVSGTSGAQGFQNWEIPWAQRLQQAGYVALVVDSFTGRGLAFADHWKLSPEARGQDALDAAAFLAHQPFVRTNQIGAIGRSGGGSALFSAIVERSGQVRRSPFRMAAVDYGYCQLAYGDWSGGTAATRAPNNVYRTSIPLLITMGTLDTHVPVASCVALASIAKRAGVPVTLRTYAGADHAFDTAYGDGTPAQQADVIDTIAAFIATYVAPAPGGTPIHLTAAAFESHLNPAGGSIVVRMQPVHGSSAFSGSVMLTQKTGGVAVALNLAEGAPLAVAQVRQGSCAQLYPEVAYRLGNVVNGTGSGVVPSVRLSYLMNGHFTIVVAPPSAGVNAISACADIPRST
jgi:dienelactone hydrolase